MKALRAAVAILAVLISLPIVIYLQYQILQRVNASELMWFLFWANTPLTVLINVISRMLGEKS